MKVVSIVGARPQFIKASPLSRELRLRHHEILVHTGQHYDRDMSDVFFEELGMPVPDYHLGIGSGPHGAQTGAMLAAIETVLQKESPDAVIVYGDTNSTLAGALAAAKLHLPVAHVEAGLRSFNRRMPEEINRVVTDHLSAWLLAPSEVSRQQLAQEGIVQGVHVVGDIMVDALHLHGPRAAERSEALARHQLRAGAYYLATVHRAENTDEPDRLRGIFTGLADAGRALDIPVLAALHPRTQARLKEQGVAVDGRVRVLPPLPYLDFLGLHARAALTLTDSGGLQEEACTLGVPCVTLRDNTERPESVDVGANVLAGADPKRIVECAIAMRGRPHDWPNPFGDGHSGRRILGILRAALA